MARKKSGHQLEMERKKKREAYEKEEYRPPSDSFVQRRMTAKDERSRPAAAAAAAASRSSSAHGTQRLPPKDEENAEEDEEEEDAEEDAEAEEEEEEEVKKKEEEASASTPASAASSSAQRRTKQPPNLHPASDSTDADTSNKKPNSRTITRPYSSTVVQDVCSQIEKGERVTLCLHCPNNGQCRNSRKKGKRFEIWLVCSRGKRWVLDVDSNTPKKELTMEHIQGRMSTHRRRGCPPVEGGGEDMEENKSNEHSDENQSSDNESEGEQSNTAPTIIRRPYTPEAISEEISKLSAGQSIMLRLDCPNGKNCTKTGGPHFKQFPVDHKSLLAKLRRAAVQWMSQHRTGRSRGHPPCPKKKDIDRQSCGPHQEAKSADVDCPDDDNSSSTARPVKMQQKRKTQHKTQQKCPLLQEAKNEDMEVSSDDVNFGRCASGTSQNKPVKLKTNCSPENSHHTHDDSSNNDAGSSSSNDDDDAEEHAQKRRKGEVHLAHQQVHHSSKKHKHGEVVSSTSVAAAATSGNRAAAFASDSTNELGTAAGHDTTMDIVPTSMDRLRSSFYRRHLSALIYHLLAQPQDMVARHQFEDSVIDASMLWGPYESALRRFNTQIATVAGKKQQQPATAVAQQDTSVASAVVILPCIIEAVLVMDNAEVRIEAELLYAGIDSVRYATKTNMNAADYEFYDPYGKGKYARYCEYRCPFIFVIRRVSSPTSPLQCTVGSFFSSFHAFFRLATTNPGVDGFDAFKLQGTSVSVKDVLKKLRFKNSFCDSTDIPVTVVRDIYRANNAASSVEDLQSYERPSRVLNNALAPQPEVTGVHHRVCASLTAAAAAAGVSSGIESLLWTTVSATLSAPPAGTSTFAQPSPAPTENGTTHQVTVATEGEQQRVPRPVASSTPAGGILHATGSSSMIPPRVATAAASSAGPMASKPTRPMVHSDKFDAMCRSTTHVESCTVVENISVVDLLLAQCKFECNSVSCDPVNCPPPTGKFEETWMCPHYFVHLDRMNINEGSECGRDVVVDNSVLIRMHLDKSNTSFKLKSYSTNLHRRLAHNSVGRSEWDNRILFRGGEKNLKPITALRDLYECRVYGFEPLRQYLEQFRTRNYGFYEVELLVRDRVDTHAKLREWKGAFGGSACLLCPFKNHLKVVQAGVYRPTYQLDLPSAIVLVKIEIPTPPAQLRKLMRAGYMIVPVDMKLLSTDEQMLKSIQMFDADFLA